MESKLKYGIFILALGFIAAGVAREEHLIVLQKAVKICLECIGVG
ncbi:CD1871A family CXXC motif-containing protein [Sinanaerobacter sp. ZZT-01]|nr:CD1871A family CXXC motif-containing protein [Sinanaerobacter sp. ZZT-01]WRR95091.1 CD1871A family CXXC motif-containing protein [Sinanaerobacter sp. ZZT-01]